MTSVGAEWDERLAVLRRQFGGGSRTGPVSISPRARDRSLSEPSAGLKICRG